MSKNKLTNVWEYQPYFNSGCYCVCSIGGNINQFKGYNIVDFKQWNNKKIVLFIKGDNIKL